MTAPSVDAETLAAYFHPLLPETWDDPVVGPVLRRLAETAPEVIAAVADVDRALFRRPLDVDGATRGAGDASSGVHRGNAGGEVAMVGADAGQQMLLALLDAGVEFIVVGGTAAVMMGAPVVTFDIDIVHRPRDGRDFLEGAFERVVFDGFECRRSCRLAFEGARSCGLTTTGRAGRREGAGDTRTGGARRTVGDAFTYRPVCLEYTTGPPVRTPYRAVAQARLGMRTRA
ncbi:MAG: hypothetical protein IPM54_33280 [Polyangiaceae bacterium]|nr:hypothetical protein [Polyangiaceae bacterium]